MQGWIKLHRKITESIVWTKPELLKVWLHCLLKASHKKNHFTVTTGRGETIVTLQRGQLIWGRMADGKKLKLAPSTAERHLKKLQTFDCLTIQPFTHYSIITVLNYDDYQAVNDDREPPTNNQRTTNEPPTNNQRSTNEPPTNTYKNVNKEKKDKNVKNEKNEEKAFFTQQDYFIDGQPLYLVAYEKFIVFLKENLEIQLNEIIRENALTGPDELEKIICKVFESKCDQIAWLQKAIKEPWSLAGKPSYWAKNEKLWNKKREGKGKPTNKGKTWKENQNDIANIDWAKIYNSGNKKI